MNTRAHIYRARKFEEITLEETYEIGDENRYKTRYGCVFTELDQEDSKWILRVIKGKQNSGEIPGLSKEIEEL